MGRVNFEKRKGLNAVPLVPSKVPDGGVKQAGEKLVESRVWRLRLVTPIYGGGVKAGQIDLKQPVRATSIRGHLRYWWRLLYCLPGCDWPEARRRELAIWGSADEPSAVQLAVKLLTAPAELKGDRDLGDRFGPAAYALFPPLQTLQFGEGPELIRLVKEGLEFELRLSWPGPERMMALRKLQNARLRGEKQPLLPDPPEDIAPQVEAALAAWVAWGGLGARTRRGLGAIEHSGGDRLPPPVLPAGAQWLVSDRDEQNALEAWKQSVRVYQAFRQSFRGKRHNKPRSGKSPLPNIPGRSHWPEPDSIRRLTNCSLTPSPGVTPLDVEADQDYQDHRTPVVNQQQPNFPRAVLGLPIVFHFADGPGKNSPANPLKDPAGVELVPKNTVPATRQNKPDADKGDRMASPVITRPVHINGKWRAGVFILPHEHALNLQCLLVGERALWDAGKRRAVDLKVSVGTSQIAGGELANLRKPLQGFPHAIAALVAFLAHGQDGEGKALPRFTPHPGNGRTA